MGTTSRAGEATTEVRGARIIGSSSVYPYKAQRFVMTQNPTKRALGNGKRIITTKKTTTLPIQNEKNEREERCLFPSEGIEKILEWLPNDTLFLEIEALAERSYEMRHRLKFSLGSSRDAVLAPSMNVPSKRSSVQRRSSAPLVEDLPFDEEAYVHRILVRTVSEERKRNDLNKLSNMQKSEVGNSGEFPTGEHHKKKSPSIEVTTSLEQLAFGTEGSDCNREESKSPIIVEIMEETGKEKCLNLQSLSPSPSSVARHGVAASGETGVESSLSDSPVSLRDASPPRTRGVDSCPPHIVDLYHVVQIPRAHYILSQVNFSSW
ncbi:uncharacterized protein TM35_000421850 [Trypanosoma theileri]|uniref:Uncharacterized protein n=1 Tax=Trypanosoma theileri TaxID=67003 RepID=A0A1X0NJB2_9TRYP|nr:uncharacterized protein TM35_000421850 [Trypanosoma theileri]ORC84727.1 hypothetical protein TM35_000421850 [Trypanosoma theileri]